MVFTSNESTDTTLLAACPPQDQLGVSLMGSVGPGGPWDTSWGGPGSIVGRLRVSVFKRGILLDYKLFAGRKLVYSSS